MTRPVFVVGCPRSGTTLLGHLLMSSGGFATYRAESHWYDLFLPRYGSPANPRARKRLADAWLRSDYHARTGIPAEALRPRLLREGTTGGGFLHCVMSSVAEAQGAPAWVDTTPAHALYIRRILSDLPDACFVHVIRDGRDVAVSLAPRGWIRSLPWDRGRETLVASWVWDRIVRRARRLGRGLGRQYVEVSFESLVSDPGREVARLAESLDVGIDLAMIERRPIGAVRSPNSSFGRDAAFQPVGRWRTALDPAELADIEASIGPTLHEFGYELSGTTSGRTSTIRKGLFQGTLEIKQLLRTRTRLGAIFVDPESAAPPGPTASD